MITLSLIAKNEENDLAGCLDSVKNIVDEIVVVDTGSTDRTIEVAEKYGAKVYNFTWNDSFADARNYALEKSSGDWILYLDADERLSEKSTHELIRLGKERKKKAYRCTIINRGEVSKRPSLMRYVRFFPRDPKVLFEGSIHEQIEYPLIRNGYKIVESDIEILHLGYDLPEEELKIKAERNLRLLLLEQEKNPSSYYAYQLGQTYAKLGEKEKAVKYFEQASLDKRLHKEYLALASRYIAVEKAEQQNWSEAVKYITASLEYDGNQPLALMIASKIYIKIGDYLKAEKLCRKAYDVNSKLLNGGVNTYQTIMMEQKELLYHAMNIAVLSGNKELFNFFFPKCVSYSDDLKNEYELFDILLNNKKMDSVKLNELAGTVKDESLELILSLLKNYDDKETTIYILEFLHPRFSQNPQFLNFYGLALTGMKRFDEAETRIEDSFKINQNDPSTVFYLISIYLQTQKVGKIAELLTFAENKYQFQPEISAKVRVLREKIQPFLK